MRMLPRMKSNYRLVLGVVTINLLLFELLSFIGFAAIGVIKPDDRLDLFIERQLEDENDAKLRQFLTTSYDHNLGWDTTSSDHVATNKAGEQWTATYDDLGSRRSCMESRQIMMATYGDSFTHGNEVDDEQTWQCILERRFGKRVLNFGVGGYGIGQALLKMKQHWKESIVAPITMLVIYSDDLARVVNRYRPFYNPGTRGKFAFKPGYRYLHDEVRFLPNPLTVDVATKDQVAELTLSVASTDYWESARIRVAPTFPYSLQTLNVLYRQIAHTLWEPKRSAENLWNTQEGREILLHLLRDFVASAGKVGTRPILMLIPRVNKWKHGRIDPAYREFVTRDLLPESLNMSIIDLSESAFDEERFSILPYTGHPSPYGNRIIGESIFDALEVN
jgi:hypothetical protein